LRALARLVSNVAQGFDVDNPWAIRIACSMFMAIASLVVVFTFGTGPLATTFALLMALAAIFTCPSPS